MHLLYIGYYTSDELLYEIQKQGINNMSVARQKYETNLLTGLLQDNCIDDIHLVSYVPVREGFVIPHYSDICGHRVEHFAINRHSLRSMIRAKKEFERYLISLGDDALNNLHVLMYEVNPLFMISLLRIKKKYNIKLVTLCAELSMLRRSRKIKYQIRNRVFAFFERKFDGFILFAKPMEEVLKCQNKPHVVIEGIAPEPFGSPFSKKKNIVMYAGGLGSDNNMRLLIDACRNVDNLDELWICGTGKDKGLVEECAKAFHKLHYYGMQSNDVVRKMETESKLLINLRLPTAQITRYSFPSKILEYMASGTLVLSTRLEGIPTEYYEHLLSINTLSLDEIINRIQMVFRMSDEEYIARAKNAQDFVTYNKNRSVQSERIIRFVRSI